MLSAIQNLGGNHDLPQPSPANDSSYSIPVVSNQSGVNPLTSPGDSFLLSETAANHLKIPSARTIPDHILAWPILEGKYPPECLQEAVFESAGLPSGLDADGPSGGACRPFGTPSSTSSLIESEVLGLVERFLSMVHTKNPILDDDTLRRFANIVIEEGLSWNGPSCLVVRPWIKVLFPLDMLTKLLASCLCPGSSYNAFLRSSSTDHIRPIHLSTATV